MTLYTSDLDGCKTRRSVTQRRNNNLGKVNYFYMYVKFSLIPGTYNLRNEQ